MATIDDAPKLPGVAWHGIKRPERTGCNQFRKNPDGETRPPGLATTLMSFADTTAKGISSIALHYPRHFQQNAAYPGVLGRPRIGLRDHRLYIRGWRTGAGGHRQGHEGKGRRLLPCVSCKGWAGRILPHRGHPVVANRTSGEPTGALFPTL